MQLHPEPKKLQTSAEPASDGTELLHFGGASSSLEGCEQPDLHWKTLEMEWNQLLDLNLLMSCWMSDQQLLGCQQMQHLHLMGTVCPDILAHHLG